MLWQAKKTSAGGTLQNSAFAAMVEDMPLAVMTCDLKDFKINYLNKATIENLRLIESSWPGRPLR